MTREREEVILEETRVKTGEEMCQVRQITIFNIKLNKYASKYCAVCV